MAKRDAVVRYVALGTSAAGVAHPVEITPGYRAADPATPKKPRQDCAFAETVCVSLLRFAAGVGPEALYKTLIEAGTMQRRKKMTRRTTALRPRVDVRRLFGQKGHPQ